MKAFPPGPPQIYFHVLRLQEQFPFFFNLEVSALLQGKAYCCKIFVWDL